MRWSYLEGDNTLFCNNKERNQNLEAFSLRFTRLRSETPFGSDRLGMLAVERRPMRAIFAIDGIVSLNRSEKEDFGSGGGAARNVSGNCDERCCLLYLLS